MTAKVTFRVTTYWKRPRNEAGITQLASQRIPLDKALNWVLEELPGDAVTVTHGNEGDQGVVTLRIDWNKVPEEIRDGTA